MPGTLNSEIIIFFSESVAPSTVNGTTFVVVNADHEPPSVVSGTVLVRNNGFEAVFQPSPEHGLPYHSKVRVILKTGPGGITDEHGNPLLGVSPNEPDMIFEFLTSQ